MKTEIKNELVEKVVKVEEKRYILELTRNEAVVCLAAIGHCSDSDIKENLRFNNSPSYKRDSPYESGEAYAIYEKLLEFLKQ